MQPVKRNSLQAWVLASRPKTLSGALLPVVMASALAWNNGVFQADLSLLCILFAATMQIAANFINDLFDFQKGTDREDRLGPERAVAQGWISPEKMKIGLVVTLSLACVVGLLMVGLAISRWADLSTVSVGEIWDLARPLVIMGVACVVFAFLYTMLLSYVGLGDVLVLVFFGFVPVLGTYFLQARQLPAEVWWLGAACGLVVDTLLVLNNYRDRDTDRRSGKRTLIAVWGEKFGRYFYLSLGFAGWACLGIFLLKGNYFTFCLPIIYIVLHVTTWRQMIRIYEGKALNKILGLTSRNMLVFALIVSLGLLLDK